MSPPSSENPHHRRLYVVATVHLDTQWRWTIRDTIAEFIPNTLARNFELIEEKAFFVVSFEGAFRYQLAKEYYPDRFEELRTQVTAGRWRVAGSMLDSPDVNVVAPESLIRHVLYGNGFFHREFGCRSEDIFLPDCFGFSAAVPSVAAHCGLLGFSAQKFGNWMAGASIPFELGNWLGPDGQGVIAAIRPEGYGEGLDEDLSQAERYVDRIDRIGDQSGLYLAMKYVGIGDRGGGLDDPSIDWLERSLTGEGPIEVVLSGSDQLFRDLGTETTNRLPKHQGDLLLPTHGTGCWTSQAVMKRWNRQNELLAEAAEKAATIADHLGVLPYPKARFEEAWTRFLWHQMHDDITGTSIPAAYRFSWNDELLSLHQFSSLLTESIGGVATGLDTVVSGEPIIVFNPLSVDREGIVEIELENGECRSGRASVVTPQGDTVAAQVTTNHRGKRALIFRARVPALGMAVFDLRLDVPIENPAKKPEDILVVDVASIENHRYRVAIDAEGNIASLLDKKFKRELLAEPIRLELLSDRSSRWPAWEIQFPDLVDPPREVVGGPASVEIVESGPVRSAVQLRRQARGSTFVQTVRLSTGSTGNRLEVDNEVEWKTRNRLLKAAFRLRAASPRASYDLGLGFIDRGNNRPEKYEVPAQQWADLTDASAPYGVSILNDCKYGWDKPDERTLRLSLLRSPRVIRKFRHQGRQDLGTHRFQFALYGHGREWRPSHTSWQAAQLNQPLLAFRTGSYSGPLGRQYSFLGTSVDHISVRALKQLEADNRTLVRLYELDGARNEAVRISPSIAAQKAEVVDGQERPIRSAAVSQGDVVVDVEPFGVHAVAIDIPSPGIVMPQPRSLPIRLAYNCRAATRQGETSRRGFDGRGHSYPAELLPSELTFRGVRFELADFSVAEYDSVSCRRQTVELPDHGLSRLHFLAASKRGVRKARLSVGDKEVEFTVPAFSGFLGRWDGKSLAEAASSEDDPLILRQRVARVITHRHGPNGNDEPYLFCYLFEFSVAIDSGARELRLPESDEVCIFAVSASDGKIEQTRPASSLYG